MPDEYTLLLSAKLPVVEFESGLAAFKAAVAAMPFTAFSVTHEDGKISVRGDIACDSATDGDEWYDRTAAAMLAAFPSLDDAITHEDPVLGSLYYLDDCAGFEGTIQLGDEDEVRLILVCPPAAPPPALLDRGRDLVTGWPERSQRIAERIAAGLLDLYNNNWRTGEDDHDSEDSPLTSAEFLARLTITSVGVNEDLSIDLHYDADGMFTDHGVGVRIWPDNEISATVE